MPEIVQRLEVVDTHLDRQDWRVEALALVTELGEFVNELPWRPWRIADQRPISAADRERAGKELGDILGTVIRVAMHTGFTGADIERLITEHVTEKERRVRAGIDGRA